MATICDWARASDWFVQANVISVKTDLRYWPCWQLKLDPATAEWTREVLTTTNAFAHSGHGGGLGTTKDAATE